MTMLNGHLLAFYVGLFLVAAIALSTGGVYPIAEMAICFVAVLVAALGFIATKSDPDGISVFAYSAAAVIVAIVASGPLFAGSPEYEELADSLQDYVLISVVGPGLAGILFHRKEGA